MKSKELYLRTLDGTLGMSTCVEYVGHFTKYLYLTSLIALSEY